jgi:hypothetical protein
MATTGEKYCNPRLQNRKTPVKSIDPASVTYVSKEERSAMDCTKPVPIEWRYSLKGVPVKPKFGKLS